MSDEAVSRPEFDMLRQAVSENARRLDSIDQSGTRGVGVVQQQITDLAKDVAGLQVKFDKHESEHGQSERDRRSSRRWLVTSGIALLVALEGPLAYLVVHVR